MGFATLFAKDGPLQLADVSRQLVHERSLFTSLQMHLLGLPLEILEYIFAFLLSPGDRESVALACKTLAFAIRDSEAAWKRRYRVPEVIQATRYLTVRSVRTHFVAAYRAWLWEPDLPIQRELFSFFQTNPYVPFNDLHRSVFDMQRVEFLPFHSVFESGDTKLLERAHAVLSHRFTVPAWDLPVFRTDARKNIREIVAKATHRQDCLSVLQRLDAVLIDLRQLWYNNEKAFQRVYRTDIFLEPLRTVDELSRWIEKISCVIVRVATSLSE